MSDNGLVELIRRSARGADDRLAGVLHPVSAEKTDRYIASSVSVRFVDRLFRRWCEMWPASTAGQAVAAFQSSTMTGPGARNHTIALMVLVAAVTHGVLTIAQGPRPGWFWMVIPGMAIAFGLLVLAASRPAPPSR